MTPLPDRGLLAELPPPLLLVRLADARFEGALVLRRERATRRVLLRAGCALGAELTPAPAGLAAELAAAGRLSPADAARVVQQAAKQRCREEKALLDLGLLGAKELLLVLREQLRRRILDVFGWSHGEYELDASQPPPADARALALDLVALVQDGVSAHWSPERTLAALAPHASRFAAPAAGFPRIAKRLQRDAAVDALLAALDGSSTLAAALAKARSPAALAAAFVLDASGALAYRDSAQPSEPPPEAPPLPDIEIVVSGGAPESDGRGAASASQATKGGGGGEAERVRQEVLERHARLAELDHYELLGVARNAEAGAIKRAYFQLAKRFHPDAVARLGLEDLHRQANELFGRIAKAHGVLSDPEQRRAYDDSMGAEGDIDADRLATAESLYRKAEILVRMGNFADALQYLRPAVDLWPDDSAYRDALGWALYKKAPSEPKPAREQLERAVALDPQNSVAHYHLGVVLRALGESDASAAALARAKQLDPKTPRA